MGGQVIRVLIAGAICLLAASSAIPAQAAFPGQNGKIAFLDPTGNQIYKMDPDGTNVAHVTAGLNPTWSPDGTRLAFDDGEGDIWVVNEDGTSLRRITNGGSGTHNSQPAWAPDGQRLVFNSRRDGSDWDLYVIGVDGSGEVQITNHPAGESEPAWSPDGSRIVFDTHRTGDAEIHTIQPDGSDLQRLTFRPGSDGQPQWSPDGTQIVFMGQQSQGWDIYVMSADGTNQRNVTNDPQTAEPTWSPDGSKIVMAASWPPGFFSETYITLMNPDGSGRMPIHQGGLQPDWQPIPGPQRGDYKNASLYCKALRDFLGDAEFSQRYKNHGKCVSASL